MLIETPDALAALVPRVASAPRLAVDVESNGLFAYRPALCVLQLAWEEDGAVVVAVVDTLAVPAAPLAPVLGEAGPVKVLHDLTFDARLLAEASAPLARVRDTSVAARFLGRKATGLAALLTELGVTIDKRLQQHDWSRRPLGSDEIEYLGGDVRHLLALDDHLERAAVAGGVTYEIAEECAHKLATATGPKRDPRPGWTRVKGAQALDAPGRAALRRLWMAREAEAEVAGVPPFRIATNEVLLELARLRPIGLQQLQPAKLAGAAALRAPVWLDALAAAGADADVPADELAALAPPAPSRAELSRRRAREVQVSGWRRAEAARRHVDEQAVLPGHCADDLVSALVANDAAPDPAALRAAIAAIPGLGRRRLERYGELFASFGSRP